MRIVFMGTPEFAGAPLEQLLLNKHQVVAVYTRPDKPAGRGREPTPPPVKKLAQSCDIPVVQPTSLKNPAAVQQLADFKPDALVVAAFGQFLPQEILDIPRFGCLNIHPSLLPRYRGPSPVPTALLAGDIFIGVSIMHLDAGMDTGPVFSRAQIAVLPLDNSESLLIKLFQIGARILCQVLAEIPAGKLVPQPQNESEASYTREITGEDGLLDWKLSAVDLWKRVRAYQPWPGAYTNWQGKHLKVIEALPLSVTGAPEIGRVVPLLERPGFSGQGFAVGTGKGLLAIYKLQIEGKRAMPAADFLRGQPGFLGSILGTK